MGSILWVMTCLLYGSVLLPTVSTGQQPPVTIDGSLQGLTGSGNNAGLRKLSGQDIAIDAEMGLTRGSNLFHSFGRFNVPDSGKVTFSGPSSIENILSRVTGNDPSNINGVLASTIDDANLYLMNPNGIIFGKKASLNVKGSFYATTANSIEFEELIEGQAPGVFHANKNTGDILTTAAPEAFGFLNINPGKIEVIDSDLIVSEGRSIMFIGGDIKIASSALTAPSGQITVVSTASSGEVISSENNFKLNSFETLGNVDLSDDTSLDASGNTGGKVIIRGGQLLVNDPTENSENQARVTIAADTFVEEGTNIGVDIEVTRKIKAHSLDIRSSTEGSSGKAGAVTLTATDSIDISKSFIDSSSFFGEADGGSVTLTAPTITLDNTVVSSESFDAGTAGTVQVNVDSLTLAQTKISATSQGIGQGGLINITGIKPESMATDITITDSSELITEGIGGSVTAGEIALNTQNFTLSTKSRLTSKSFFSEGNSGNIVVKAAEKVIISGGSQITSSSLGDQNSGNAGNINIRSMNSIEIVDQGTAIKATTGSAGIGGNITIRAENLITLANQATVSSESEGSGDGGNISIVTATFNAKNGNITASSKDQSDTAGGAGSIVVETDFLDLAATRVATTVEGGQKPGGDITLKANRTALFHDGTTLLATNVSKTFGGGKAGNITIAGNNNPPIVKKIIDQGREVEKEVSLADSIRITDSSIITNSNNSEGGNIELNADFLIHLINGTLKSEISEGTNGGTIDLDPRYIVLQGNTSISTAAFGKTGDGGKIFLGRPGDSLFIEPSVELNVSSQSGVRGTLRIQAAIQQLSESVAPLSEVIVKVPSLFTARCAAQKDGQYSSFTNNRYQGNFPRSGDFLSSPLFSEYTDVDALDTNAPLSSNSLTIRLDLEKTHAETHRFIPNLQESLHLYNNCTENIHGLYSSLHS